MAYTVEKMPMSEMCYRDYLIAHIASGVFSAPVAIHGSSSVASSIIGLADSIIANLNNEQHAPDPEAPDGERKTN